MTSARSTADFITISLGTALVAITSLAWYILLRNRSAMVMPADGFAFRTGSQFTIQWGVMMAAMMLPSATPMILLYRTVSRRLAVNARVAPATAFAAIYLLVWMLVGVPVYAAHVLVAKLVSTSPIASSSLPYAIAAVLGIAGIYQFSNVKRVCLRYCEAPLTFLMRRWRAGYLATLRLALEHALYCLGCCWALMAILVVAGAMSLPWVLGITLIVFAEKILPHGQRTARAVGIVLILLGIAIAIRPELAGTLRPQAVPQMPRHT